MSQNGWLVAHKQITDLVRSTRSDFIFCSFFSEQILALQTSCLRELVFKFNSIKALHKNTASVNKSAYKCQDNYYRASDRLMWTMFYYLAETQGYHFCVDSDICVILKVIDI